MVRSVRGFRSQKMPVYAPPRRALEVSDEFRLARGREECWKENLFRSTFCFIVCLPKPRTKQTLSRTSPRLPGPEHIDMGPRGHCLSASPSEQGRAGQASGNSTATTTWSLAAITRTSWMEKRTTAGMAHPTMLRPCEATNLMQSVFHRSRDWMRGGGRAFAQGEGGILNNPGACSCESSIVPRPRLWIAERPRRPAGQSYRISYDPLRISPPPLPAFIPHKHIYRQIHTDIKASLPNSWCDQITLCGMT